jgi:hypothetical protein
VTLGAKSVTMIAAVAAVSFNVEGSTERETRNKLFIEWVMPYPDFLQVISNMFLQ